MKTEKEYKIEFGKQVAKYLKKSGLDINDFARLIKSNTDNVNEIIAGKVGLTISKMINIAGLFGQVYYNFANPNYSIPERRELVRNIEDIITRRKSIGKKDIDKGRLLATELDKLIAGGHLNTPITSKLLHAKMDNKLAKKKTSEITSLLGRPPRDKIIISIGTYGTQKIYIHQDYASQHKKLSKEELIKLITDAEQKASDDKKKLEL